MLEQLRQALDPALFWEYRTALLTGLVENLAIFIFSAVLATALAFAVGLARLSRSRLISGAATVYAEFFRNAPEYVLLVWVYYVLPILASRLLATKLGITPELASVLALGAAYSGFLSETVRAGFLSVPRGHSEAALALGMSRLTIALRIVAPQAIRRTLPEALNQFVSLFKATSMVSLITVEDIMYKVSMISIEEMRPLPLYTGAALLYCSITIIATQSVQRLTDRWRRRGWA
jgi:polar amino acid transport system permease protein